MPSNFFAGNREVLFHKFENYSVKKVLNRNVRIQSYMLMISFKVHDGRFFKEISLNNKTAYVSDQYFLRDLVLTKPIGFIQKKKKGKKR